MKTNTKGFTLIEVMVAVAIIAIALPSLLVVMMGHIDGSAWLRDKLQAQWVAENQLTEIRIKNHNSGEIPIAEKIGEEELAGRKWQWRSRAKAFEQLEFSDIYGVEVAVWYAKDNIKDDSPLITLTAIMQRSTKQTIRRPTAEVPSTEIPKAGDESP